MSIIQDALKKAGRPVSSKIETPERGSAEKASLGPDVERHRKESPVRWGPFFVVSVLLVITAPILVPLLYRPSESGPAAVSASSTPQGQFAVEEIPIQPLSAPVNYAAAKRAGIPQFTLSGVVYSEKESYCLLNGRVLKTGEQTGGATVEKITPTEVWLSYNGERLLLPVTD